MSVLLSGGSIVLSGSSIVLTNSNCPTCCGEPCEFENGLPKPQCCCDPESPEYCGPAGPCDEPPFEDPPTNPCDSDICPSLNLTVPTTASLYIAATVSGTWLHPAGGGTSTGSCSLDDVCSPSLVGGNLGCGISNTCFAAWTPNIGSVSDITASTSASMGCSLGLPFSSVSVSIDPAASVFDMTAGVSLTGDTLSFSVADIGTNPYTVVESVSGTITPHLYCGRVYGFSFTITGTVRPSNPASTGRKTITASGVCYLRSAPPPVCCNTTRTAPTQQSVSSPSAASLRSGRGCGCQKARTLRA